MVDSRANQMAEWMVEKWVHHWDKRLGVEMAASLELSSALLTAERRD